MSSLITGPLFAAPSSTRRPSRLQADDGVDFIVGLILPQCALLGDRGNKFMKHLDPKVSRGRPLDIPTGHPAQLIST